jgi:GNAT superfamily N-acetyltransferase
VTEWGIAYLHGKTIRERALELIQVAHPDFRSDLLEFVHHKHYVRADEKAWEQISNPYPFEMEELIERKGQTLRVRPLRATDERALQEFFYRHDPDTVYERYFFRKKELGHAEAATLCCVDYHRRMALGVWTREAAPRLVGVARYDLDPSIGEAETAVVIDEGWRRLGLASHLLERLETYARKQSIRGFRSEVLVTNGPMIQYHHRRGHSLRLRKDRGSYVIHNPFQAQAEDAIEVKNR